MPESLIWDVTIRTFSWLHIGSGETLLHGYDYALHNNRTWRLNLDALLEEKVRDQAHAEQVARVPPGTLLDPKDFRQGSPLFRYVLDGEPRSKKQGAQLREQIKDVWDRPYLPGSSVKGALRTAILWNAVKQSGRPVTLRDLNEHQNGFAAQPVETDRLRQQGQSAANYDLLRALQVTDSAPLDTSALMLANAQVIGGRTQKGAPIELEAISPNVPMTARIKVDLALFTDWARRGGLELGDKREWIERLPRWVQLHSQNLAQRGLVWCERNTERQRLVMLYRRIEQHSAEEQCYLQIGWGGGWDSKTLGNQLQQDPAAFEEMATQFDLRRGAQARPGTPFPSTRRMVVRDDEEVRGPLGWALMTFRRRE